MDATKQIIFLVFMWGLVAAYTTRRECYVRGNVYNEGDMFQHTSRSGCAYNCTCEISNGRPIGNCTHRCSAFTFPPGCHPTPNACGCAADYECPDGEKCQDKETGLLYSVGETWSNSTCTCRCLGNRRGVYQCECRGPPVMPARLIADQPCVPDPQETCYSCPTVTNTGEMRGNPLCGNREKCEKWGYLHSFNHTSVNMTCTCYGPRGFTQCVNMGRGPRRGRRSIPLSLVRMETAGIPQMTSSVAMVIDVD
uniref:Fibronectin-like n=2 Tax=Ciona intestinalis TaxID=7719 RepID=F6TWX3_CIOIN|nr:fibronectin-like isoform X2 [Ciona intestinalis]|eukprot:XP_026692032.1 fibronectin-like isoform X2 [Ciona intestinalis]